MSSSAKADAERDMRREREEKHRLACRASTNELRKVLAAAGNELDHLEEAWAGTPASRKYVSDLEHELHELKSAAKEAQKKATATLKEARIEASELRAEVETLKARQRDYPQKIAQLEAALASGVRVITKRVEVPAKSVHPPPSESLIEERRMKLAWMRRALELGSDPEIAQAWRSQGRLGPEIEDPDTRHLLRQATFRVLHQGGWPHQPHECPLCPKYSPPSTPGFPDAEAIHTT